MAVVVVVVHGEVQGGERRAVLSMAQSRGKGEEDARSSR